MSATWLDRTLHSTMHHMALCIGNDEYVRELKRLKVPHDEWPVSAIDTAFAETAHVVGSDKKGGKIMAAFVIVQPEKLSDCTLAEVHALLVHEAVHLWHGHCAAIGESHPSEEFEAYSIQQLSLLLMKAYDAKTAKPVRQKKKKVT